MYRLIFTSLALFLLSLYSFAQTQATEYKDLDVEEFNKKMKDQPEAVVLDVRTDDEVKQGTIANAQQIDFFGKDFERKLDVLDKNKVYFVYCASGGRSGETKELMESKGFKTVYNLKGGFTAWKKAKMPVTSPKG